MIKKLFTEHPRAVNETYLQHMQFAVKFGAQLSGAAIAAFVHAILPFLFTTTASRVVRNLFNILEKKGRIK